MRLFKKIYKTKIKDAISYKHIIREFGDGFLFSRRPIFVDLGACDVYTSGEREDFNEKYHGADITVFKSPVYTRIVRPSVTVSTSESSDEEHELFLLQENSGIIRAVYCIRGEKVYFVEGYSWVYDVPDELKKYLVDPI